MQWHARTPVRNQFGRPLAVREQLVNESFLTPMHMDFAMEAEILCLLSEYVYRVADNETGMVSLSGVQLRRQTFTIEGF